MSCGENTAIQIMLKFGKLIKETTTNILSVLNTHSHQF